MQVPTPPADGMKTLYFVRHGQSLANAGAIAMPDAEIPLTELGRQQVQALLAGWSLRPTRLYCSQMLRARQTAALFEQWHGMQSQVLPQLDEFSHLAYSTVQGRERAEVAELAARYWREAGPAHRDAGEADGFEDFLARVDDFLARIGTFEDGSVFIGHGLWVSLLAWRLLGHQVRDGEDMRGFRRWQEASPVPNVAVHRLLVAGDGCGELSRVHFRDQE